MLHTYNFKTWHEQYQCVLYLYRNLILYLCITFQCYRYIHILTYTWKLSSTAQLRTGGHVIGVSKQFWYLQGVSLDQRLAFETVATKSSLSAASLARHNVHNSGSGKRWTQYSVAKCCSKIGQFTMRRFWTGGHAYLSRSMKRCFAYEFTG